MTFVDAADLGGKHEAQQRLIAGVRSQPEKSRVHRNKLLLKSIEPGRVGEVAAGDHLVPFYAPTRSPQSVLSGCVAENRGMDVQIGDISHGGIVQRMAGA